MFIGSVIVKLYVPWADSLKDKRMVTKSLIEKAKNKFNISIAEIDAQDIIKTIVLGSACVAATVKLADSTIDKVIQFIEDNTEAEITQVIREIL